MRQRTPRPIPLRLVASLVALALLPAPAVRSQEERFAGTTDVILVQIPVHVTRDGEPVRGLTAENFEVLEGRKKQKVVGLDVFDLELLPTDGMTLDEVEAAVPAAGRRNFVMLFDLSNSLPAGLIRAREAAYDLARNGLHPSDLVAVATYSKSQGIRILMSFSTDRAQLEAALDDLGLAQPFETINDPLRLRIAELAPSVNESGAFTPGSGGGTGFRGRWGPAILAQLKDLSTLTGRVTRDQIKQQIFDLSTNLDALATLLDSAAGRKQVVLFSQGFDSEVVFGTTDVSRLQEIAQNVEYGEFWRVDGDERFGASDAQSSLLAMLERFNRSDCAVHTVDVAGLVAGGDAATVQAAGQSFGGGKADRGHDGLALMSNQTGGEFYRNFNDLTEAMDELLDRTSVTYVLSVEPRDLVLDGSYHPLKIKLKGVEKGIDLSHRPGYYARRPYSELNALERQMVTAEQLVAGQPGGSIGTDLLAAAFPGSESSAYVLTAIEVDGRTLVAGHPDNMVPAEIYTYAFDERGQIRDFFSQAVALDLYKIGYRLDTGFKLLSHLELPPGRYEVRSLVRNARTGASGLAVRNVEVPAFAGGEPVLLPPFFIEPDDHWLVGRGERDDGLARYPLMGTDKPMVPASHPRLVSDQQIPVLLVGHDLPASLEAEGRLIGPDGKVHESVAIDIERRAGDRGDGERLLAKLLASNVKPGEYQLIVTVRGDGREATSSVPVSFLN